MRNAEQFGGEVGMSRDEVEAVAAHYDIGVIRSVKVIDRGSAAHLKVVIRASRGDYLLKRRPGTEAALGRIREIHELHRRLSEASFAIAPLRALVSKGDGGTYLVMDGALYEMMQFIRGKSFEGSSEGAWAAGEMLSEFHHCVASMKPPGNREVLARSYHDQGDVIDQMGAGAVWAVRARLAESGREEECGRVEETVDMLVRSYKAASARVEVEGFYRWPRMIVHGDWHPGNMVYRTGGEIAAVLDLDSMRFEPRATDVANGAFQFSMRAVGNDPRDWPDSVDEVRLTAFCSGYDAKYGEVKLSLPEVRALPWLMIEALVAESLAPVAVAGIFHNIGGAEFLAMVERKVRWLRDHAGRIVYLLGE